MIYLALLNLFLKNPSTAVLQAKAERILLTISSIVYYLYEKNNISWNSDYDISES